jgi:hypothetical protein
MATAEELRRRREAESIFSSIYDAARENEARLAAEGRRPVFGGLLSKEPVYGTDTVRWEGNFSNLFAPIAKAIDAPISAARGLIPAEDMTSEAFGTAGMAGVGSLGMTAPRGSLTSGGARRRGMGDNGGPPMTKEQLDPIGYQKTKMRGPLTDTDVRYTDTGENLPRQPITWESLLGKVVLPFYGDRTSRGLLLSGVDDVNFDRPVYTEGGVDFKRGPAAQRDRAIWASNQNIVTRIANEADKASRSFEGRDIVGVTGSMSPDANDFATFTGAAMAELVQQAPISKKAAKQFDDVMRSVDPEFVGVKSPKLRDWAESTTSPNRKAFIRLMDSKPMQDLGFPEPARARYAVTDPTQREMKSGMFGLGASKIDREAPLMYNTPKGNKPAANVPHSTYNTQIAGDYLGSLEPIPQGLLFRDVYDAMEGAVTKGGKPLTEAHRTHAIKTKMPAQLIDDRVMEGILQYLANRGK